MLYAELPGRDPARKTVLFYMHLDGQPVIPAQWAQKSPWTPVLKRRAADGGQEQLDRGQKRHVATFPAARRAPPVFIPPVLALPAPA